MTDLLISASATSTCSSTVASSALGAPSVVRATATGNRDPTTPATLATTLESGPDRLDARPRYVARPREARPLAHRLGYLFYDALGIALWNARLHGYFMEIDAGNVATLAMHQHCVFAAWPRSVGEVVRWRHVPFPALSPVPYPSLRMRR